MSSAPLAAASSIRRPDFSTVASRSRKTGAAWMAAALNFGKVSPMDDLLFVFKYCQNLTTENTEKRLNINVLLENYPPSS